MNSSTTDPLILSLISSTSSSSAIDFPFYHAARLDLIPLLSDKYLSIFTPVVVYWAFSLFFHILDNLGWDSLERHRIHESDEVRSKNRVGRREVIWAVILQHAIQTALGLVWLDEQDPRTGPMRDHRRAIEEYTVVLAKVVLAVVGRGKMGQDLLRNYGTQAGAWMYWWGVPIAQFIWAAFVLDGWQYFWHRYFHVNTFLYRHVHSWHHRLYVPYAYGALYNHPLEGFVLDTLGGLVSHTVSGMTIRQTVLFFGISTAKTVDDHCGFAFPWDPMQHLFGNNADYHDIHHQTAGLKRNFSQPYFIHFDWLFNTRMTRTEFESRKYRRVVKGEPTASQVNGPNELASVPTSDRSKPAIKED